jgi:hypothetical protein
MKEKINNNATMLWSEVGWVVGISACSSFLSSLYPSLPFAFCLFSPSEACPNVRERE